MLLSRLIILKSLSDLWKTRLTIIESCSFNSSSRCSKSSFSPLKQHCSLALSRVVNPVLSSPSTNAAFRTSNRTESALSLPSICSAISKTCFVRRFVGLSSSSKQLQPLTDAGSLRVAYFSSPQLRSSVLETMPYRPSTLTFLHLASRHILVVPLLPRYMLVPQLQRQSNHSSDFRALSDAM